MAEAKITLTLKPDEYRFLRDELSRAQSSLATEAQHLAHRTQPAPRELGQGERARLIRELTERESRIVNLLAKI